MAGKKGKRRNRMKLGLALGAGGARGLIHVGVLKVLHKHKIYPDYLAGTSMGAVMAAVYAAGHSPEEIEEIAKTTDWKNIVDFTVPKAGLISGKMAERKIRRLVNDKDFKELNIPLQVVSYNLTKRERVVFVRGDVAEAVCASISIPGIFAPLKLGRQNFVDGAISDPTPFDVVREMGADVVIAVDLFSETKKAEGPVVREEGLFSELRKEFVATELLNVKNYLFPKRWPRFFRRMMGWLFDRLLYPAKVLRIMTGRELPMITKVMYDTVNVLTNNLAKERLKSAKVDVKITPSCKGMHWADFNRVGEFVRIGEKAMERKIGKLKRKLGKED